MTIQITRANKRYATLLTQSEHPFVLEGKMWATVDHYVHAQKFAGTPLAEAIRLAPTHLSALRMAKEQAAQVRSDWVAVEQEVLTRALWQKLRAHEEIAELLLTTGAEPLADGTEANRLGQALMALRNKLAR